MMKHLEKHNVLTSLNHGFRSGYSCEAQLVVTIHDMLQSFDKEKQVDIGILDPFLNIQDTFAFSQSFGSLPWFIERWNMMVNAGVRWSAHCFRTLFGMLSGPM
jgi:hypothetical protein